MLPGEAFTFVKTVTRKMKCPGKSQLWEAFSSSEIIKRQIDGRAASNPMSNLPLLQRLGLSPERCIQSCITRHRLGDVQGEEDGPGALSRGLGELA